MRLSGTRSSCGHYPVSSRDAGNHRERALFGAYLLAAGVAHEIGNPLNSLDIHLQLMERRVRKLPSRSRGEFEDSINVARQEVKRLDHIITHFSARSVPSLSPSTESLNAIVDESVSFLQAEIRDRDILVEVDLDRSLPTLGVDRDQIKQAFYNIIRNAFQAMKTGGILRIRSGPTRRTSSFPSPTAEEGSRLRTSPGSLSLTSRRSKADRAWAC